MTKTIHRKGGGQPGNHNALKHSLPRPVGVFYSSLRVARRVDSVPPKAARKELDHDVALTRATLKSLLARDPHNIKLITYSLSLLNRLIRTRQLLIDRETRAKRRPTGRATRESSPSQIATI